MRRIQVIEAMNFAEKRGFIYVIEYNPNRQYKMHFYKWEMTLEVAKHLEKLEMPVKDGTLI